MTKAVPTKSRRPQGSRPQRITSDRGGDLSASAIVADAAGPVVATDLDGTITDWNHHSTELLGHLPADAIGCSLLALLQPTDYFGNPYRTASGTLAAQALSGQAVHAFELDVQTRNEKRLRVALSLVFVLRPERSQCRAVYLLSPLYRRRRADEALERILNEGASALTPKRRASDPMPLLSARQRQVLRLLVDGLSAPAIAERLGISVHTVRNHVQAIYERLGVKSRAAAVSKALSQRSL